MELGGEVNVKLGCGCGCGVVVWGLVLGLYGKKGILAGGL